MAGTWWEVGTVMLHNNIASFSIAKCLNMVSHYAGVLYQRENSFSFDRNAKNNYTIRI